MNIYIISFSHASCITHCKPLKASGHIAPFAVHTCFPLWASLGHISKKKQGTIISSITICTCTRKTSLSNCQGYKFFCLLPLQRKPPVCHAKTCNSQPVNSIWGVQLQQIAETSIKRCRILCSHPNLCSRNPSTCPLFFVWNQGFPKHARGCIIFPSFLTRPHFAVLEKPTAEAALMVFLLQVWHAFITFKYGAPSYPWDPTLQ